MCEMDAVMLYPTAFRLSDELPGLVDNRLWWEQTSDYWQLPFYSEMSLTALPDRHDALAAREQLFAMRELFGEGDFAPLTLEMPAGPAEPDL